MKAAALDVSPDILRLAEECGYEQGHTLQVTRLALRIYDQLQPLHLLPGGARRLLLCAAMLHDIGWCEGQKRHHKTAYQIITSRRPESLSPDEAGIVGLVARYHRKALPSLDHAPFATLSTMDREMVEKLSAILRVADGLDRGHRNAVRDVRVEVTNKAIRLFLATDGNADVEIWGAQRKADLFVKAYGRRLDILNEAQSAQESTPG